MAVFQVIQSVDQLEKAVWDDLNQQRYPFLDYRFLKALEQQRCIGGDSGWQPQYLALYLDEPAESELANTRPDAVLPTFLKEHSYGEYVFDWSWAEAYQRHGFQYYPKLLCAAPFTPATGPRLLFNEQSHTAEALWPAAIAALDNWSDTERMSGWHLNFPNQRDTRALQGLSESHALLFRRACQFHWFNRDYRSFEHFLETFSSRKRKSVKKERKRIQEGGIELRRLTADTLTTDAIERFYTCYQLTYMKRGMQGYLNKGFFKQLVETMAEQMLLVEAWLDQQHLASALYFFDDQTLYGRYWGCLDEYDGLHFEACYYQGIGFCIERSLQHFDPGTQGEHKIARGFEPVLTTSLHRLHQPDFNAAVADFLEQELPHILEYQQQARTLLPFKEDAFGSDSSGLKEFAP